MLQPMGTLGVLNFNLPPGLTMKLNNISDKNTNVTPLSLVPGNGRQSKTFNKITVQNVLSENNANAINIAQGNPNAIVRKIKDFGMIGTVNSAGANSLNLTATSRKRLLGDNPKTLTTVKQQKASHSVAKKPKLSKEEKAAIRMAKKAAKENANLPAGVVVPIKIPGTPGRKGLPLPQAVARRNARERNRVKQVNNGFAALRERIPEEVAEAFEAHSSCKNNGKKLSKVETLRMAVEYIRSLERLLGFDFPLTSGKGFHSTPSSGEDSFSMIKDEFDAYSPSIDEEQFEDSLSHYDVEEYFAAQPSPATEIPNTVQSLPQVDTLPNITTLNGLQYIRISGTNTYQLLTPDIFVGTAASPPSSTVDEEHFNALIDTNCVSPTTATTTTTVMSTSMAHSTVDQNSSPPSIRAAPSMCMTSPVQRTETTAPVTAIQMKCVGNAEGSESLLSSSSPSTSSSSSSSISPVPQQKQQQIISPSMLTTSSSPSTSSTGNTTNNNNDPTTTTTAITNLQATTPANTQSQQQEIQMEDLRQKCALNQRQQQQRQQQQLIQTPIIKQEFEEKSFIYQQQQQQHRQQHQQQQLEQLSMLQQHHLYMQTHNTMNMSPPLEHQTPTTSNATPLQLQQFFQTTSNTQTIFFDNVINLKKEFTEDLLDGPHTSNVLSDESMIETIDWWEAYTPKSEGGSVMM